MEKGKFIVIDGGDGSGKATQCSMLLDAFTKAKLPVLYVDFPRYDSFFGSMIGTMMRGEYGSIQSISPYLASLPYAMDRKEMKEELIQTLNDGVHIVANRYTTANMGHQASKLKNIKEQDEYLDWINKLEYEVHGLPKEDMVLYLHVAPEIAYELGKKKNERLYIGANAHDEAEKDLEHQKYTEQTFLRLCKKYKHWNLIECVDNEKIFAKEHIHNAILNLVEAKLNIF